MDPSGQKQSIPFVPPPAQFQSRRVVGGNLIRSLNLSESFLLEPSSLEQRENEFPCSPSQEIPKRRSSPPRSQQQQRLIAGSTVCPNPGYYPFLPTCYPAPPLTTTAPRCGCRAVESALTCLSDLVPTTLGQPAAAPPENNKSSSPINASFNHCNFYYNTRAPEPHKWVDTTLSVINFEDYYKYTVDEISVRHDSSKDLGKATVAGRVEIDDRLQKYPKDVHNDTSSSEGSEEPRSSLLPSALPPSHNRYRRRSHHHRQFSGKYRRIQRNRCFQQPIIIEHERGDPSPRLQQLGHPTLLAIPIKTPSWTFENLSVEEIPIIPPPEEFSNHSQNSCYYSSPLENKNRKLVEALSSTTSKSSITDNEYSEDSVGASDVEVVDPKKEPQIETCCDEAQGDGERRGQSEGNNYKSTDIEPDYPPERFDYLADTGLISLLRPPPSLSQMTQNSLDDQCSALKILLKQEGSHSNDIADLGKWNETEFHQDYQVLPLYQLIEEVRAEKIGAARRPNGSLNKGKDLYCCARKSKPRKQKCSNIVAWCKPSAPGSTYCSNNNNVLVQNQGGNVPLCGCSCPSRCAAGCTTCPSINDIENMCIYEAVPSPSRSGVITGGRRAKKCRRRCCVQRPEVLIKVSAANGLTGQSDVVFKDPCGNVIPTKCSESTSRPSSKGQTCVCVSIISSDTDNDQGKSKCLAVKGSPNISRSKCSAAPSIPFSPCQSDHSGTTISAGQQPVAGSTATIESKSIRFNNFPSIPFTTTVPSQSLASSATNRSRLARRQVDFGSSSSLITGTGRGPQSSTSYVNPPALPPRSPNNYPPPPRPPKRILRSVRSGLKLRSPPSSCSETSIPHYQTQAPTTATTSHRYLDTSRTSAFYHLPTSRDPSLRNITSNSSTTSIRKGQLARQKSISVSTSSGTRTGTALLNSKHVSVSPEAIASKQQGQQANLPAQADQAHVKASSTPRWKPVKANNKPPTPSNSRPNFLDNNTNNNNNQRNNKRKVKYIPSNKITPKKSSSNIKNSNNNNYNNNNSMNHYGVQDSNYISARDQVASLNPANSASIRRPPSPRMLPKTHRRKRNNNKNPPVSAGASNNTNNNNGSTTPYDINVGNLGRSFGNPGNMDNTAHPPDYGFPGHFGMPFTLENLSALLAKMQEQQQQQCQGLKELHLNCGEKVGGQCQAEERQSNALTNCYSHLNKQSQLAISVDVGAERSTRANNGLTTASRLPLKCDNVIQCDLTRSESKEVRQPSTTTGVNKPTSDSNNGRDRENGVQRKNKIDGDVKELRHLQKQNDLRQRDLRETDPLQSFKKQGSSNNGNNPGNIESSSGGSKDAAGAGGMEFVPLRNNNNNCLPLVLLPAACCCSCKTSDALSAVLTSIPLNSLGNSSGSTRCQKRRITGARKRC